MIEKVNVICMKWGTLYSPDYVNKLFNMVSRNLTKPFNFYCFTDDAKGIVQEVIIKSLPEIYIPKKNQVSPWRKLSMFAKELDGIKGKTLFLDLDKIIVDNIDCFFEYSDKLAIIENWTQKGQGIGNSAVYCFEVGKYPFILENFNNNPEKIVQDYDNEQIYLSKNIGKEMVFWPDSWCKSFKRHCIAGRFLRFFIAPQIPKGAKIIVFHGHPRPHEAIEGRWPKKLIPYLKTALWIQEYWK
jgi:hypothetical protein